MSKRSLCHVLFDQTQTLQHVFVVTINWLSTFCWCILFPNSINKSPCASELTQTLVELSGFYLFCHRASTSFDDELESFTHSQRRGFQLSHATSSVSPYSDALNCCWVMNTKSKRMKERFCFPWRNWNVLELSGSQFCLLSNFLSAYFGKVLTRIACVHPASIPMW